MAREDSVWCERKDAYAHALGLCQMRHNRRALCGDAAIGIRPAKHFPDTGVYLLQKSSILIRSLGRSESPSRDL